MKSQETPQAVTQASPSHPYFVMSLAALAVMLLVLWHQGMQRWSFLPVLAGLLGLTLRWRITPLFILITLAGLLLTVEPAGRRVEFPRLPRPAARGFSLADWLLCGAVLAFCNAQYRLQALRPRSLRLGAKKGTVPVSSKGQSLASHTRLVSALEISWLLLSLPIWAFLAQLCWRLVAADVRGFGFTRPAWHSIVLFWLLGMGALVVAGTLNHIGHCRLRLREARLFLQDAFWQETSREQRRLNSWLAWTRLRQRRKEKQ